eukprot:302568-Lingulodinium_polyedra.AAC.1
MTDETLATTRTSGRALLLAAETCAYDCDCTWIVLGTRAYWDAGAGTDAGADAGAGTGTDADAVAVRTRR